MGYAWVGHLEVLVFLGGGVEAEVEEEVVADSGDGDGVEWGSLM